MLQPQLPLRGRARHLVLGSDGPRRYLAPHLSLAEFFDILRRWDVPYVVLRWFESLPHVDPGEDIDILIADDHLEFMRTLLLARPVRRDSQAFDLYTVSGLPRSDFKGVPYYPPQFARAMLDDAIWLHDRYRVPNATDHFRSLAYHAAYHKGYASGLGPETDRDDAHQQPDHDYRRTLAALAARLGIPMIPTLDRLDRYLADEGLRPPLDTLECLAGGNAWIRDRHLAERPEIDPVWCGLVVFVLRERAQEFVGVVADDLDRDGFEILDVVRLDSAQREVASQRIRGGNWERGPWPISGGTPSHYIIGYDVAPHVETTADGWDTNLRIHTAKAKARERILRDIDVTGRFNPLHSSDNPRQALDYIKTLGDEDLKAQLHSSARKLVETCAVPFPVVRFLEPNAPARRARVVLVQHPVYGPAVCKIFRPGAARFFQRELRARMELRDLPEVPDLLQHGGNWLLTPFYPDDERHVLRRLPSVHNAVQLRSEAARVLARFARTLHARGAFMLDLSTNNLLSDPATGLKVLDLEFLQEYAEPPPCLLDSYTVRGLPPAARNAYDEPQVAPLTARVAGNSVFHPAFAGLGFEDLLRSERPSDTVRRSVTQMRWYCYLWSVHAYRTARRSLATSRWGHRLHLVYSLLRTRKGGRP